MALNRLIYRAGSLLCVGVALVISACATSKPSPRSASERPLVADVRKADSFVNENIEQMKPGLNPPPFAAPDYQWVSDDISPAKSRLVNIQTRNSPLGDILHVIADAAGLNLIVNDGVLQDKPITITLKRVTAEDALTTVLAAADYFYTIKNNILTVEATGTKTFELGHPAIVQAYNVDVGGDILGSGSSLTTGSSSGSSNIKGTITQNSKADAKAFDFWETLEKSLQEMLGLKDTAASKQQAAQPIAQQAGGGSSLRVASSGGLFQDVRSAPSSGGAGFPAPTSPAFQQGSGMSGEPRQYIAINRLTGTILVTATRKNLNNVEVYLDQLKKTLNRQVMVEARVIEVQLDESLQFGIDWSFLSGGNGVTQIGGGFGTAGSSSLSTNLTNAAPSFRIGLLRSGDKVSIGSLLTALKTQGEVKTLSNPRINVMNGQTALLSVGRNFNYISKVTTTSTTASGSTPTITYSVETGNILSGVLLGLLPSINSKGEIKLTVTPIISDLVKLEDKTIGSDVTNQIKVSVPTVDLRELSTTVKLHDGEMLVIGGLIANKQDLQDTKVPVLGDLPLIGGLFTQKKHADKRTELIVVLRPHLIQND